MATTFKDLEGNTVTIEDGLTSVSSDTDVESGEVTRYIVEVDDIPYEVAKKTYEAVKKHIGK
ncbi:MULTISPECIES: hypothetical protein [Saccharibacillus]|uniref:Uncharacterized protein n=1 Tax=Saccharibacillus endophyticus TaxID=2060666 RepID=A0ABQ2AC63_9BACL|nr:MULTISPECIES: hypothetical protein [Saccharibacillus]GGH88076.1 hypothetical protein GCM10007362_51710 [Saccharibacillus endophyticus]